MLDFPTEPTLAYRVRIQHLLFATLLAAIPLGIFAPELRSWDRHTRVLFTVLAATTIVFFLAFTPLWIVMLRLRSRTYRGLRVTWVDYAVVCVVFFVCLGLLAGVLRAALWLITGR